MKLRPAHACLLTLACVACAALLARAIDAPRPTEVEGEMKASGLGPQASGGDRRASAPVEADPLEPRASHLERGATGTGALSRLAVLPGRPPEARGLRPEASDPRGVTIPATIPVGATLAARLATPPKPGTGRLVGRVVDAAGAPVAGAWIQLASPRERPSNDPFGTDDGDTQTDESGTYALEFEHVDGVVQAIRAGFLPGQSGAVSGAPGADTAVPDIVLARRGLGWLSVHVAPAQPNGPLPAQVRLRMTSLGGAAEDEPASGYERFAIDADTGAGSPVREVTAGKYAVELESEAFRAETTEVAVDDGATVEARLLVTAIPGLRVRFVDDATGEAVQDVSVSVASAGQRSRAYVHTDESGVALVPEVEPGPNEIYVVADGYSGLVAAGARADLGNNLAVDLDAATIAAGLTVRLLRGSTIRGVVRLPDGSPARGAEIHVFGASGRGTSVAKSGGDGAYVASGFADRVPSHALIVASLAGFAPAKGDVDLTADAPSATLDLTLAAGGSIAGHVIDAAGKPAAGALVQATPADPAGPSFAPSWRDPLAGQRVQARAGSDGAFRLDGLAAGATDVMADLQGFAPGRTLAVPVAAGETTDVEIALEGGARITGHVVDSSGAPVLAGGALSLQSSDGGDYVQRSCPIAGGAFTIDGLEDHLYYLWIQVPGFQPAETRARAGADLTVQVRRGSTIAGRVAVPDGARRPSSVSYMITVGDSGMGSDARVAADGTFRIDGIDPSASAVSLEFLGFPTQTLRPPALRLVEGGTTDLALDLVPGGSIAGRVLDASGAPVAGASVSTSDDPETSVETDASGAFRIGNVAPGVVTVAVDADGRVGASGPLDVASGAAVAGVTIVLSGAPAPRPPPASDE